MRAEKGLSDCNKTFEITVEMTENSDSEVDFVTRKNYAENGERLRVPAKSYSSNLATRDRHLHELGRWRERL